MPRIRRVRAFNLSGDFHELALRFLVPMHRLPGPKLPLRLQGRFHAASCAHRGAAVRLRFALWL
jgi:hypothetical protein